MASTLRLNDAGTMVGKAAHGRLKSPAVAVNSNSLHFGTLMVMPSANRNSYRVAFGCILAHIISTHSKDGDLQWPQLNPGLGNRNSYRVAFEGVLAHIISTHSKDGDSQWPKLWAAKTVGLGNATPLDFRYAQ